MTDVQISTPYGRAGRSFKVWTGSAFPLGATYNGAGTNFSLYSEVAEGVQLCLFDDEGHETRVDLPERTAYCWHGFLPEVMPGQAYGYRVYGAWNPPAGVRCCPQKLLLDPYAKAVRGQVKWNEALFAYRGGDVAAPPNIEDSAPYMPKSVVINPYFDWRNDRPPNIDLLDTVIYEVHVKGFSMLNPEIPPELRGTYAGLAHPASIDYLKRLGVTAVELMPVHQFIHDKMLIDKGLRNYWGYNSIGFFAPHNEYAAGEAYDLQVQEFKQMVQYLHRADIEVILDVVYNHTAEGNHMGPMLSLKGIDNPTYYRLMNNDPRYYMDYTGTGNTLNVRHPATLQLIMDSLRYWVTEMHVDGFRFDLAATLARTLHDVDRLSAFFDIIHQDPVISQVKLIAEPWDIGEGGYQVGKFPAQWSEWNGKYRDTVRDYWRGQNRTLGEFANRFAGSSDLYQYTGRRPHASINFVTAHDGFTLDDLVSYDHKHNLANGEDNRDGSDDNRSWNCGAEGPTDNPGIIALRNRQKRNFIATLLLSQGTPMVLHGDEIGRTSGGNNNSYCQDNELNWLDWEHIDEELMGFVAHMIRLRRLHPTFRRNRWFHGRRICRNGMKDITWYRTDGREMSGDDWRTDYAKALAVGLCGDLDVLDARGQPVDDDDFLILFNAAHIPLPFRLPPRRDGGMWLKIVDTTVPRLKDEEQVYRPEHGLQVEGRSMVVLQYYQDV